MQDQPRPGRINRGLYASTGRHQPWPVHIGCGLHRLARRRRQTAGNISQGVHASDVACLVGQTTSANGSQHQPWPAHINHGVCESAMAYAHRPRNVGQWQAGAAKACTHLIWHVRTGKASSANDRKHQPRLSRISRGVCTSAGRHRRRAMESNISQGLHASDVACTLRASDVGQRQMTSAMQHWSWTTRIGRGLCTSLSRRQPWTARIGRGLCISLSRRRA